VSACARRLLVQGVRGGVCIGPRWDDLVFKAVCQPDGTWHVFLRLTAGVLGPFLVVGGLILDSFSLSLLFIACFMQVGDNNLGGALWMVSGLGALELKRNHNPLGIDVLIMLDEAPVLPEGRGRWSSQDFPRGQPDDSPIDAFMVVKWNIDSMYSCSGDHDCPNFIEGGGVEDGGHIGMLCRAIQALSRGKVVAVCGISAVLMHIWLGSRVSLSREPAPSFPCYTGRTIIFCPGV
jgi:hypothetical protein